MPTRPRCSSPPRLRQLVAERAGRLAKPAMHWTIERLSKRRLGRRGQSHFARAPQNWDSPRRVSDRL